MIFDKLENLHRYLGTEKYLDKAIGAIQGGIIDNLQAGRTPVDGEQVYINCFGYNTADADMLEFESHLRYLDLHIVLSGGERVEVCDSSLLQELSRNEDEDCILLQGKADATFALHPDWFLLLYPGEAHKPKISLTEGISVQKAVVKIAYPGGIR